MFVIWGSTTMTRTIGDGIFYCPRCQNHTSYVHRRVRKYFTLYFIPLFPTELFGDYLECQKCGVTFPPAIRDLSPAEIEERQRPWTCSQCQSLNPRSEMRCLNCKARRPGLDGIGSIAPAQAGPHHITLEPPSQSDRRLPARDHQSDSRDLEKLMASNRCPECGVVNSLVALHCKGCGCRVNGV